MKQRKRQELAAGLFTLLGLGVAMGIVLWMSGFSPLGTKGQRAYFFAELERGKQSLLPGAPVCMGDTEIGKVVSIEMDYKRKRTIYTAVISTTKIQVHSTAEARVAAPLVGKDVSLVILDCGDAGSPLADQDHAVRLGLGPLEALTEELDPRRPDSVVTRLKKELDRNEKTSFLWKLHEVMDNLGRIAGETGSLLSKAGPDVLKAVAGIREAVARAAEIIADAKPMVHRTLEHLEAVVSDARPKVAVALADVAGAAAGVRRVVEKDLGPIMASLRTIGERGEKVVDDLKLFSEQVRAAAAFNRPQIDAIVSNMVLMSETLKATANDLRREPWRLMNKPDKGEMANQAVLEAARAYSLGAAQLEQAMTRLRGMDPKTADPKELESLREHLTKTFARFKEVEELLWKELNR